MENGKRGLPIMTMTAKLSVKGAIVAGAAGGLLFGINYGLQALVAIFQITGATGFISGLTVPFILALASQHNRQWGTATIAWTLYSLLAIPTVLMGLPGPLKVPVGFLGGLAYDLGYCGLRCKKIGLYVAMILYVIIMDIAFYLIYVLGLMKDLAGGSAIYILFIVTIVFSVEGLLSTWLASIFYEKRLRRLTE